MELNNMPSTYDSLATTTVGTATGTITLSSIPSGYTDLVLVVANAKVNDSSGAGVYLFFNSDFGANYSTCFILTDAGANISSNSGQNTQWPLILGVKDTATNAASSTAIVNIMSYSNATNRKTVLTQANNSGQTAECRAVVWQNTSAINSITLLASAGYGRTFNVGTRVSLYGILRA
jgi:hypothetical protein